MCLTRLTPQRAPLQRAPFRRGALGRRQRGMTLVGALCVLALVGVVGYAGLRLAPMYLNYMKVERAMDSAAGEANPDPTVLRRSLAKHWEIDDIVGIGYDAVEVVKNERGVTLHVVYDDSSAYIANVSLSVHFDKTVKVQ